MGTQAAAYRSDSQLSWEVLPRRFLGLDWRGLIIPISPGRSGLRTVTI